MNEIHGESKPRTRLYNIWCGMKARTLNKNSKDYPRYGGRKISICDEWRNNYISFKLWALQSGYADNLSIERMDNNKGYSPDNCAWKSNLEQSNNRRSNSLITANGETHTISEWSRNTGICKDTIWRRINTYGWNEQRAVSERAAFGRRWLKNG